MSKFQSVLFIGIAAAINMVSAVTDEEKDTLRKDLFPIVTACQYHLPPKEPGSVGRKSLDTDSLEPCFYACFFKKTGVMNSQGLYDPVAAKAGHKKYIHDKEDLKKLNNITDICTAVNGKPVSDGPQGCERGKLLARCLSDNSGGLMLLGKRSSSEP